VTRLIVDCDPGHDDAVALAVAAHHGDLVGITTVGGNAPLADVTANALLTCQLFGIEAEVRAGADRPLVAPPRHAPEVHGVSGFAGVDVPVLDRRVADGHAVDWLIETIRAEEGLWLVPIGPLTNVALAFRRAPDLPDRLAGVSFMGGSATIGNRTPVAEFNVMVDPEAAAVVLGSGARIHMAGLDLTAQFPVDDALSADLRGLGGVGARLLADLIDAYLDRAEVLTGARIGGLHDPCAVLAVTHPEVVRSELRRVDVELNGSLTRGMTVVDQRPAPPGGRQGRESDEAPPANVHHGHTLDHPVARGLVLDAIAVLDGTGAVG
jgi:inosine-uridine nucleoside N-ribohydrolase